MFRNSRNSQGLSAAAGQCRNLILELVLVLAIGSLGQTSIVQAAADMTELRYSMSARKLKGNNVTICVGDDVPIHVRVTRAEFVGNQGDNVQNIPGVRVEASMSNGGIGKLNPISIYTGWDSNDPGGADYKFHAEKVGTTTISFKGTINHVWWPAKLGLFPLVSRRDFVEAQVEISVEECQYKVTTISHFSAQGVALVATMEGAMTKGADGRLTGSATVNWVGGTGVSYDCSSVFNVAPSQAELVGEQDGDQLIVDVTYLPATLTNMGGCPAGVNDRAQVTPDPVTVTVSTSGGGERNTQDLFEPKYYSMHGFVVMIVTRANQH